MIAFLENKYFLVHYFLDGVADKYHIHTVRGVWCKIYNVFSVKHFKVAFVQPANLK